MLEHLPALRPADQPPATTACLAGTFPPHYVPRPVRNFVLRTTPAHRHDEVWRYLPSGGHNGGDMDGEAHQAAAVTAATKSEGPARGATVHAGDDRGRAWRAAPFARTEPSWIQRRRGALTKRVGALRAAPSRIGAGYHAAFTMTDLRVHDHRSWCSRWSDVGVHDAPIFVFTMGRRQRDGLPTPRGMGSRPWSSSGGRLRRRDREQCPSWVFLTGRSLADRMGPAVVRPGNRLAIRSGASCFETRIDPHEHRD